MAAPMDQSSQGSYYLLTNETSGSFPKTLEWSDREDGILDYAVTKLDTSSKTFFVEASNMIRTKSVLQIFCRYIHRYASEKTKPQNSSPAWIPSQDGGIVCGVTAIDTNQTGQKKGPFWNGEERKFSSEGTSKNFVTTSQQYKIIDGQNKLLHYQTLDSNKFASEFSLPSIPIWNGGICLEGPSKVPATHASTGESWFGNFTNNQSGCGSSHAANGFGMIGSWQLTNGSTSSQQIHPSISQTAIGQGSKDWFNQSTAKGLTAEQEFVGEVQLSSAEGSASICDQLDGLVNYSKNYSGVNNALQEDSQQGSFDNNWFYGMTTPGESTSSQEPLDEFLPVDGIEGYDELLREGFKDVQSQF